MRLVSAPGVAHKAGMMAPRLLVPLLLLAGCGQAAEETPGGTAQTPDGALAEDNRVDCSIGGETMGRDCTIERSRGPEGTILTIRQPDGGFRRLLIATDGRGVVAADGAEAATVKVIGQDLIEVSIGPDRYRLPARVR